MIRNAIIHLLSEQPVVADLLDEPKPTDALVVCTNLRTLDGRRPVFIDDGASTFVFPYLHIRFIEIRSEEAAGGPGGGGATTVPAPPGRADDEGDLEIDEDFLRRIREA